jgi:GH15 family glucan-1,4-alpha-glucosidase
VVPPPSGGRRLTRQSTIGEYGFLSDCHSAALVGRDGTVEWWCLPRFDSASVFGKVLGPEAGHWSLCPTGDFEVARRYVGDTLVLSTVFSSDGGEATVTDALGLEAGARGHDIGLRSPHVLLRRVECRRGSITMTTELAPRTEYGRTVPHFSTKPGGVVAEGGPVRLSLSTTASMVIGPGSARSTFVVSEGETVDFALSYAPSYGASSVAAEVASIDDTVKAWESWVALHQSYSGRHPDAVRRSSLVLQGLTFQPSGAVIAAATTSLPETIGGDLNFDYRFAWLRDLSLTVRSLWIAACPDEPKRVLDWVAKSAGVIGTELIQIMYGVGGERDCTEHALEHLPGFADSSPVRVGNGAWAQKQLDVLGEVLDAAYLLRDNLEDLSDPTRRLLVTLAERAAAGWEEPDAGMWESRDAPRHYLSSKVMCWVALDRAVKLAPLLGVGEAAQRWATARDAVRAAVHERGWNEEAGAYTGAFDSEQLDASVLVLALVGFLPARDDRMWSTIRAVERELGDIGLVRRWAGDPFGFLICTYWLAECLALGGEVDEAEAWFERAGAVANDLGLLSEEADPKEGELLGNFPQAFSHVGLINAAWRISEAAKSGHDPSTTTKEIT